WGIPITNEVNRLTGLVDARVPTAWTNLTMQNGWFNPGSYNIAQYRKVGDIVYLRGVINGTLNSLPAFTLPAGFRPPANLLINTGSWSPWTTSRISLNADGTAVPDMGPGSYMPIDFQFSTSS
ncbi:MAG: hypothetical protein ABWY25_02735, partial [Paenisporosarcina sp.]